LTLPQLEHFQSTLLPIIQQQIAETFTREVSIKLLL
jgi:hypothetical protein